jgi:uncharacterized protein YydD (DUF2326 family)
MPKLNNNPRVTIEITPDGWETTIHLNGKSYTERHKKELYGSSLIEGSFKHEDDISDILYEAVSDFYQHDVMNALNSLRDE